MHADLHLAGEAFRAGATGYVLKQSAGEELVFAIHEVLRGRVYLGPQLGKDVVTLLLDVKRRPQRQVALTPRQREILQLVAEGRTMKEVAGVLGISRRTAESHKYLIMRQLGVQTSAELIRYAVHIGLVPCRGPSLDNR
jgi:DNA-binding NarL/FixJ family response regulator